MQKIGRIIAVMLVSVVGFGLGGYFAGKAVGRKEMVVEAVKNNHGHYRITDELGGTSFEWGPAPAGSPPILLPK